MIIDHAAIAPLYALAGAALVVLLAELFIANRPRLVTVLGGAGLTAAGGLALTIPTPQTAFCATEVTVSCSYATSDATRWVIAAACAMALIMLVCAPAVVGEYVFLLLCSVLGLAVLVGARDVLTLVVAVETLTLPTYALVSLGIGRWAATGAFTMFVISVLAASISLLGAALLYSATGALRFSTLAHESVVLDHRLRPMAVVGGALLIAGLLFKVAAVPFHNWAPAAYQGAPRPVAGYLATVSKLGGVVAVVLVILALPAFTESLAPLLAVIALTSMTVGNLAALRQSRILRLLAWSSIAQLGFVLAPLGMLATTDDATKTFASVFAYLGPYLLVVLGVFALVIAYPANTLEDLRGTGTSYPRFGIALMVGLLGLAGLPPGFAGLWAKIAVVRGVLTGSGAFMWMLLAGIAVNVVLGLAVYLRVVRVLFAKVHAVEAPTVSRGTLAIGGALTGAAVLLGCYPNLSFRYRTR